LIVQTAGAQIQPQPPVNLEYRPAQQTVRAGDTVHISLYAVAEGPGDQSVSDIEVVLLWDPLMLAGIERIDNGPYAWFFSDFPGKGGFDPDNLNGTHEDGNAQYLAARQLAPLAPFFATPEGRLVTTFVFEALAETPATFLESPRFFGQNRTRVFHGFTPNLDITGSIGTAQITIIPEPSTLGLLIFGAFAAHRILRRQRA
jgi:hypothetical protein